MVVLMLLLSCTKNFLDVDNNAALFRQNYVKDLKSLKEFLNGIYSKNGEFLEFYTSSAYPEIVSDNLKPADLSGRLANHYLWNQSASPEESERPAGSVGNRTMNGFWLSGYRLIRACDFVIEEIGKYRNENPVLADEMVGQAYAMRAYLHFKMVNIFAQTYTFTSDGSHPGIPYIMTSDISKSYSRQSVAEVYEFMITDIKAALQLLPITTTDTRFMNRLAAQALLSRIYLFKEDYAKAREVALEVTAKVPLLSISKGYPNDLFKLKNDGNTETLFQISPIPAFAIFLGRYLGTQAFVGTSDLASILREDPNDIRSSWISQSGTKWIISKFPAGAAPEIVPALSPSTASYYIPALRTSELYLNIAESAMKLGDENMARAYLNSVRKRANPNAREINESGIALMDLIVRERRKELCIEGLRMGDLQRWKLGVQRGDTADDAAKNLPFGSDKSIAPIPPQDVTTMGIPQNMGY